MKRTRLNLLTFVFAVTALFACTKKETSESSSNKARMQVFLTDDPANYDAVFIDVQDVRVNYSSDTAQGWQSLSSVNKGSYDLLRLVNNKDTLLGQADLNPGKIEQIRLVLGPNNYVVVGGARHNLQTPSAQQSGLKIKINQTVNPGITYKMLMDFDAGRSIKRTGNGKYLLKPVIRATLEAVGGSLKGQVVPGTVQTGVYAIRGADTVAGTLTSGGSYFIRGLEAGTYNLAFVPGDSTYKNQTKTGIVVHTNTVTAVDTVRLQ